jgi:aminoglycoside phosphotransferase (APT) family kinase protein
MPADGQRRPTSGRSRCTRPAGEAPVQLMCRRKPYAAASRVTAGLSESVAHKMLKRACEADGLSADDATLMRIGSNAVFHLAGPVVVRISRRGADVAQARRAVAVARWLESIGYPAVRALDVDQPAVINGHVVTFWESVSKDGRQYATVGDVADVLAQLHRLIAPAYLHLSELEPFENAARRISANDWLSPDDRDFLTDYLARMQGEYAGLEFVLQPGVIHGDASIGNVLHDYRGNPVVIDLDGFSIGPREWDLALTAVYYDSFGWHTRQEYETFTRVYGFDIMQWSGYPVMRAVREFLMVTWVIQRASDSARIAAESSKRIAALRTGASRKDWKPY